MLSVARSCVSTLEKWSLMNNHTIKLHVLTTYVLPVTNSMSSSDQMSTNDYVTCGNTIGRYTFECNTGFAGNGFECADITE